MVCGVPAIWIRWPRTAWSDANADCHRSYPITATGSAPTRASWSTSGRPSSGWTRASWKADAVISAARTGPTAPSPVSNSGSIGRIALTYSTAVNVSRQRLKSASGVVMWTRCDALSNGWIATTRSPSSSGSVMPANVSQMVKMDAPSPMVIAIASPPTSVSPHDLRNMRNPSVPSSQKVSSQGRPRAARTASRNCVTPPSSSRASRRASSGLMPRRTFSSTAIARCVSSSWSKSASPAAGRTSSRSRANTV